MKKEVSRRFVVGALGAGAAVAAYGSAINVVGQRRSPASTDVDADDAPKDSTVAELVAPLAPGSSLGDWNVDQLVALKHGAASVVLSDASGHRFQLDVCKRDQTDGARRAPGQTEHFEVFLANHGDGSTVTYEDHGLAAMALADVIRANEHRVEHKGFQTLAERLSTDAARVHVV